MSTTSTPKFLDGFENADEAKEDYEQAQDLDEQSRQANTGRKLDNAEALSLKERIQQKRRKEKTEEHMFYGEMIAFETPAMDTQREGLRHFKRLDIEDVEEGAGAESNVDDEFLGFIVGTLEKLSVDDDLDYTFWNGFGGPEIGPLFQDVITQGRDIDTDTDPEDVEAAGN